MIALLEAVSCIEVFENLRDWGRIDEILEALTDFAATGDAEETIHLEFSTVVFYIIYMKNLNQTISIILNFKEWIKYFFFLF